MLAPAISKVREFLGSWKNLLALGTLPLLGAWIYSRVWMVNPAILGDEYIYSTNARNWDFWGTPPAGDFSNYLFNALYSTTTLCGDSFYQCAKLLNIGFFLSFTLTLFVIALRYMPFWWAYVFLIFASLSPLAVYTSMFLPESMFYFFAGLVLLAFLRASREMSISAWALLGASIGVATLVKPHAWLISIPIAISVSILALGNRVGWKSYLASGGLIFGSAVAARLVLGIFVAGPQAVNFFGQYISADVIDRVTRSVDSTSQLGGGSVVGAGPIAGIQGTFLSQLNVHLLTAVAVMAVPLVVLIAANASLLLRGHIGPAAHLTLVVTVWFFALLIEIVLFTGYITGNGDDHTTRVLLRYYEYLYLFVPLAALAWASETHKTFKPHLVIRIASSVAGLWALSAGLTGLFSGLTIQIADAPTLAGLVVNQSVYNSVGILAFAGLLSFAFFPRSAKYALVATFAVTSASLGWEIQGQYQNFRAAYGNADQAGFYIRDNMDEPTKAGTLIVSDNRFDATLAAMWGDSPFLRYELYYPGSPLVVDQFFDGGYSSVLVIGDFDLISPNHEDLANSNAFKFFVASEVPE